jgi:transposase-like protein
MTRHTDSVEVILTDQRRRRWSVAEKAALVRRTYEPGMSVSLVARQEGVGAS